MTPLITIKPIIFR